MESSTTGSQGPHGLKEFAGVSGHIFSQNPLSALNQNTTSTQTDMSRCDFPTDTSSSPESTSKKSEFQNKSFTQNDSFSTTSKLTSLDTGVECEHENSSTTSTSISNSCNDLTYLNNFIKGVVRDGKLNQLYAKCDQRVIRNILSFVNNYHDKNEVTCLIETWKRDAFPNGEKCHFKPLTFGSFIFGCYSEEDPQVTGGNIYCDPVCAFSIPKFCNETRVCKANVMYFSDENMSIYLNNKSTFCYIHLNAHITNFKFSKQLISDLKSKGCKYVFIYQRGSCTTEYNLNHYTECGDDKSGDFTTSTMPTSHIEPEECDAPAPRRAEPKLKPALKKRVTFLHPKVVTQKDEFASFAFFMMIFIVIALIIMIIDLCVNKRYRNK